MRLYVKIDGEEREVGTLSKGIVKPIKRVKIEVAIQEYLESSTVKKSKCTRTNEKRYFKDLNDFLTSENLIKIDEVTAIHINKYKAEMLKRVSPATVNRQFNTLKNFFNTLIKKQMIFENPCREITHEKTKPTKKTLWTREDLDLIKSLIEPPAANILEFIWLTGARNIEALNLKWTDIDHDNSLIIFKSQKNAKHFREFPISNKTSKLLHSLPLTGLYVFGGYTSDSLGKKVRIAVETTNKKSLTIYGLRHTFCKDLLKSGMSRPLVQKLMGHADWRTTENYAHWEDDFLINEVNSIR